MPIVRSFLDSSSSSIHTSSSAAYDSQSILVRAEQSRTNFASSKFSPQANHLGSLHTYGLALKNQPSSRPLHQTGCLGSVSRVLNSSTNREMCSFSTSNSGLSGSSHCSPDLQSLCQAELPPQVQPEKTEQL